MKASAADSPDTRLLDEVNKQFNQMNIDGVAMLIPYFKVSLAYPKENVERKARVAIGVSPWRALVIPSSSTNPLPAFMQALRNLLLQAQFEEKAGTAPPGAMERALAKQLRQLQL